MYPKDPKLLVNAKRRLSNKDVLTKSNKFAVETRLRRLGVETYPGVKSVAVETKLSKLGVDTKLRRFGDEIKGRIEEANS